MIASSAPCSSHGCQGEAWCGGGSHPSQDRTDVPWTGSRESQEQCSHKHQLEAGSWWRSAEQRREVSSLADARGRCVSTCEVAKMRWWTFGSAHVLVDENHCNIIASGEAREHLLDLSGSCLCYGGGGNDVRRSRVRSTLRHSSARV
eukprot:scaffold105870_cov33-Tisochrysis_lutea.AAC.3